MTSAAPQALAAGSAEGGEPRLVCERCGTFKTAPELELLGRQKLCPDCRERFYKAIRLWRVAPMVIAGSIFYPVGVFFAGLSWWRLGFRGRTAVAAGGVVIRLLYGVLVTVFALHSAALWGALNTVVALALNVGLMLVVALPLRPYLAAHRAAGGRSGGWLVVVSVMASLLCGLVFFVALYEFFSRSSDEPVHAGQRTQTPGP